jgi:prepilin-type N-terminal cleavage/methylation domain-containing protein
MNISHIINKQHNGFTLMEVMVSVSIFTIIVTIGIGSLLTVNKTLLKTRSERQAIDSFSYAIDTMTRRLRTGMHYNSPDQSTIYFNEQDDGVDNDNGIGSKITFELLYRQDSSSDNQLGYIQMTEETSTGSISIDEITPPEIDIENFNVDLFNTEGQPLVILSIKAKMTNSKQDSIISLQTAVSQRPFEGGDESVPTDPNP